MLCLYYDSIVRIVALAHRIIKFNYKGNRYNLKLKHLKVCKLVAENVVVYIMTSKHICTFLIFFSICKGVYIYIPCFILNTYKSI